MVYWSPKHVHARLLKNEHSQDTLKLIVSRPHTEDQLRDFILYCSKICPLTVIHCINEPLSLLISQYKGKRSSTFFVNYDLLQ